MTDLLSARTSEDKVEETILDASSYQYIFIQQSHFHNYHDIQKHDEIGNVSLIIKPAFIQVNDTNTTNKL